MDPDNDAYDAWIIHVSKMYTRLNRENDEVMGTRADIQHALSQGMPSLARPMVQAHRKALDRQRAALDAWMAAIEAEGPDRHP